MSAHEFRNALEKLDARIEREIARLRARYQLSLDEFRGLYISDAQVAALLATGASANRNEPCDSGSLTAELTDSERWLRLVAAFGLTELEQDLLFIAFAPELDLKYETLYAYLNDDVTRMYPTTSLASRLASGTSVGRHVLTALSSGQTLARHRLIDTIEPPAGRPSPLNAGFAVSAAVSRFLHGLTSARPTGEADAWSTLTLPAGQIEQLQRLAMILARGGDRLPVIVLTGIPGAGRLPAAHAVAHALSLPVRTIDLRALKRATSPVASALTQAVIEARLEPALTCVQGIAAMADHEGRVGAEHHGVLAELASAAPCVILSPPRGPWRDLLGTTSRALETELGVGGAAEQHHIWRARLDDAGLPLADADCRALAERFRFTPGQVADAVATAQDWLALRGEDAALDLTLMRDAARAQSRTRLGSLASLGGSTFGWDDLVLPPAVLLRLQELAAAIRLRHVVYSEWGFSRRMTGGAGVKALFAGTSGTGKTMAAGVVAREVGLDLITVDLSGLVSKYIGETEKNLDRVFAGARAGNALLFFDEADALFGKRSEVKDAHDRYANIEVAYLLQKVEEHDGVVIMATNLRRNIDDAFARRLHYVVDFPQPDASLRERLWRGMFPAEAPLAANVDFPFLARQFDLAGGDIRNVALDAAFLAADQRAPIGMPQLVRALARQMAKQGKSPSPAEFQRYFELVA